MSLATGEVSSEATVTITVVEIPGPPIGLGDVYETPQDTQLVVDAANGVLSNEDSAAFILEVAGNTSPQHGTLVLNADGSFTYDPDAGYVGPDSFTYTINEFQLDMTPNAFNPSAPITVLLGVSRTSAAPVAVDDGPYTVALNGTLDVTSATVGTFLINAADPARSDGGNAPDWDYLDDGVDRGLDWINKDFSTEYPGASRTAAPQFGYGEGDEQREIRFGPEEDNALNDANNKIPTYYFETAVNIADQAALDALSNTLLLSMKIDDGVAVYINGVEVYRHNLAASAGFNSFSIAAEGTDGQTFIDSLIDKSVLQVGDNIVSVEVHQQSATSSDVSFDLALVEITGNDGLLGNDTIALNADLPTISFTAAVSAGGGVGTLVVGNDGSFSYTPDNTPGNETVGPVTFTYTLDDGVNPPSTATVTIEIDGGMMFPPGDFNHDNIVDATDINILVDFTGGGPTPFDPDFDLNGDTVVDSRDIAHWLEIEYGDFAGVNNGVEPEGTRPGDANLDFQVSIGDLSILADFFGSTTASLGRVPHFTEGNFNGDDQVSIADLSILADFFGFDNPNALSALTVLSVNEGGQPSGAIVVNNNANTALAPSLDTAHIDTVKLNKTPKKATSLTVANILNEL
jgi:VCBS repeat-containing protein